MKKKQILFLMVGIGVSIVSFAQQPQQKSTSSDGLSFGVRAGVNLQNINGRDFSDNKLQNKLVPGFNVGANVEFPIAEEFYVQPSVLFSTKGAKLKGSDTKVSISYIEIPVNLLFKPELGANKILLGFGPYIAFGVGGRVKPKSGSVQTIGFKNEISVVESLSGRTYFKRFDAGANLLVGVELSNKISAQLNAQLGLLNFVPKVTSVTNNKANFRNTGFGLSLGYRFGGN